MKRHTWTLPILGLAVVLGVAALARGEEPANQHGSSSAPAAGTVVDVSLAVSNGKVHLVYDFARHTVSSVRVNSDNGEVVVLKVTDYLKASPPNGK